MCTPENYPCTSQYMEFTDLLSVHAYCMMSIHVAAGSKVKGITLMVSYNIIRIVEIACSAGSGTKVIIEIETPTKVIQ